MGIPPSTSGNQRKYFAHVLGTAVFLITFAATPPARAQDSLQIQVQDVEQHSPRGALWRAAVVPGWGQIYNRQYYKLPFVYAGLGGILASAIYNNERYLAHRHALLYARDPIEYARYANDAAEFADIISAGQHELLRPVRDAYRRNRDLSYIGLGLFYALTVLDAYVNAHLLDFDVGEDLSVHLVPGMEGGVGVHAIWQLNPAVSR